MAATFWIGFFILAYVYVGYPILIFVLSKVFPAIVSDQNALPKEPARVAIVVAVHNEEAYVEEKVRSIRALQYDQTLIRIIFVSDGSTDRTNEILRRMADIHLIEYSPRRGKAHALNVARLSVTESLALLTDARQALHPDALRVLVDTMSDERIIACSAELSHRAAETADGFSAGLYWKYERWIRRCESDFASTMGASGACYIIRRDRWLPIPADTLIDDFVIPMLAVRHEGRVVLLQSAIVYDTVQTELPGEFRRKIRTLMGNYQALFRYPWMLLPTNRFLWQFVSHKLMRLLAPFAMAALLIGAVSTPGPFYAAAATLQTSFYLVALTGILIPTTRTYRLVAFSAAFLTLNAAALLALPKLVFSASPERWQKT